MLGSALPVFSRLRGETVRKLRIGVAPVTHQAHKTASRGSILVFRATEDPSSGLLQLLFIQSRKGSAC
jgi:hypothetical protein